MSTTNTTPMPRDEVLSYLGPNWPPRPGAVVVRVTALGIENGAVTVYAVEGQPGMTWWAVDGLIPPQDAGLPPDLPDCPLETIAEPGDEFPPFTLDTP